MAPRKTRASSSEFPVLDANALYAGKIRGDGNCLFNALSDQLYGNQDMHEALRAATIHYMKENANFYMAYMAVNSTRRNPRRRSAGRSAHIDDESYTAEQMMARFEEHLDKMGQPGEWADHMEVSAFASALNVHVRLWQAHGSILLTPRVDYESPASSDEGDCQTLHIAYHTWEHYSSVRNVAGPHTGTPNVKFTEGMQNSRKRPSPSVDGEYDDQLPRVRKRRSPLSFDSDSTPECTESSSDESSGMVFSQQEPTPPAEEPDVKHPKIVLKLRCLLADSSPATSRSSSPASAPSSSTTTTAQPTITMAETAKAASITKSEPLSPTKATTSPVIAGGPSTTVEPAKKVESLTITLKVGSPVTAAGPSSPSAKTPTSVVESATTITTTPKTP